ncbi:hypothetical protein VN97_g4802 [Penicillium thymicola]|uniref:Uncharacterized protein n=1 Tax=Penicillium thymicola TaxID=293382 RepID=A0AAI9TKL1_PENTH|nr:hypothetical protein VN97_g4802 [Penicillium thymicola]
MKCCCNHISFFLLESETNQSFTGQRSKARFTRLPDPYSVLLDLFACVWHEDQAPRAGYYTGEVESGQNQPRSN